MSKDDPVVDRVRSARRKIVARHGRERGGLLRWAKKIESERTELLRGYRQEEKKKT
jgi:hypothetical protein